MSAPLYWSLTAVLVVVLLLIAVWAYQTANRLDRLHVRYDLSWQALDGALARRAVVARAVAADAYRDRPEGSRLAAWAGAAEHAPRARREAAENELSAALAMVNPSA
ncbi:MAG TPA: exopolyphosphatase, partial [Mycobacterium sp.]|nr:exopolyphosphatase [Mycobacterium sp.]